MRHAGFVLAGGRSTRMGRNKALLPVEGMPLARRIAEEMHHAAGEVTLVGDPGLCAELGYPVIADLQPGLGPAGGLLTALTITTADWNLIAACDMPNVRREDFAWLLRTAEESDCGCVVPRDPDGQRHPLCAVYHRSCLGALSAAIEDKILKMQEIVLTLRPLFPPAPDARRFANLNTPEDWTCYTHGG